MKREAVAVIWDIEEVTPSIVAPFVQGLLRYAGQFGRMSLLRIYGDWSKPGNARLAEELAGETQELIHIPAARREEARTSLGAKAMDLLHTMPHIRTLLLLSGSEMIIPALQVIRTRDVQTVVVCDARSASEELLLAADEFRDFRDVTDVPGETGGGTQPPAYVGAEEALELLEETVISMESRGVRPSVEAVRVRLKLMNVGFDETKLGYSNWQEFLGFAEERGAVRTLFRDQDLVLTVPQYTNDREGLSLPEVFRRFLECLAEASGSTKTSYGNMAKLSAVEQKMNDRGVDYRRHGYSQLKRLADAAAKRGLANISVKDSGYLLSLTQKGRNLAR